MKKFIITIVSVIVSIPLFAQLKTPPKNIIVVVAHGMGYNHVKAYELHKGTQSSFTTFPTKVGSTNYNGYWNVITEPKTVEYYKGDYHIQRAWRESAYTKTMTIDAASASSSISTGIKSAYKSAGVDLDSTELQTMLEYAYSLGMKTGAITDMPFSQSGIASFAAHIPNTDSIKLTTLQLILQSPLSVLIGSGNPYFSVDGSTLAEQNYKYTVSQDFWDSLVANKTQFPESKIINDINKDANPDAWTLLQTKGEIDSYISGASTHIRLLGIPQTSGLITETSLIPSLATLTQAGLKTLDSPEGFMLIIETAAIDSASRKNNKAEMLAAMQNLDSTIATVSKWIETNSSWDESLLIIAGSYESGFLARTSIIEKTTFTDSIHVVNGNKSEIPEMVFNHTGPTNLPTPVYAKGNGSDLFSHYTDEDDYVYGPYINNTEIAQICKRILTTTPVKKPKNIILMINDGVGYNQIKAANYYTGKTEQYQSFPIQLFQSTYPLITNETSNHLMHWNNSYESAQAWTNKTYLFYRNNVTCSGAAATAIATGKKSYLYTYGVDYNKNALYSIGRHSKTLGKAVGICTNVSAADATPGIFFGNNISRLNTSEIYKQLIIESKADVIIGTDHPAFDNLGNEKTTSYSVVGGEEVWNQLKNKETVLSTTSNSGWNTLQDVDGDGNPDPWTLIEDSVDFASPVTVDSPKRLLGFAKVDGSLQFYREGTNVQEVHFDDRIPNMPSLAQMATKTLHTLNKNSNGFFVLIEGDAADNAGHKNYKGRLIEEMISFNQTVDTVIAWIEANGGWDDNLLIVTGDHETGFLCHPDFATDSSMLAHYDIGDNGKGNMPEMQYFAPDHTNQLVPIFAKGSGSDLLYSYADEQDFKRGKFLNNTEISEVMFELWGGKPAQILNTRAIILDAQKTVTIEKGKETVFALPENNIQDLEETDFTYIFPSIPKWLVYDKTTKTFTANPTLAMTFTIKYNIFDGLTTGAGIEVANQFILKVVEPSTGTTETFENSSFAYPNPAQQLITVYTETGKGTLTIYSITGSKVVTKAITSQKQEVALQLDKGTYTIEISENSIRKIQTLIIK